MTEERDVDLTEISGIGKKYAEYIESQGYNNAYELMYADPRVLQQGTSLFNTKRARAIIQNTKDHFDDLWEDMTYEAGEGFFDAGKYEFTSYDGKTFNTKEDMEAYESKRIRKEDRITIPIDEKYAEEYNRDELSDLVEELLLEYHKED